MGFWEGETCNHCGGPIVERRVTLHRKARGGYIQIENVPAGIGRECGTRYFEANVLKTIQENVRGRKKADRKVCMPVYSMWGSWKKASFNDSVPHAEL